MKQIKINIKEIKKLYYIISEDKTTIIYAYTKYPHKKEQEGFFTFNGRFKDKPTIFNLITFLEENIKNA